MQTSMQDKGKEFVNRNVSTPIIVSTVIGFAVFGAITYFAVKSGVGPLKDAAKIASGAK
ncbi:hypothetical protein [Aliamphritea ceti]|uniref:hypothetical protein n=1 Tax=Aliamphritea ceti TaxID=1524258 RepID=UPI0021C3C87D|nr:hypothetical protein [Aliamphritea ceti]